MWLAFALTSCGRVNFDPLAGGAGDGGPDATAAAPFDAPFDAPPLACELTGLSCSNPQLMMCGDTCFAACDDLVAWSQAQPVCRAWGGGADLGRTLSQAQLDCLPGITNDAWIGLVQSPAATELDTGWSWLGDPVSFTAWNTAEPNDLDDIEDHQEECGLYSGGGWIDDSCNAVKRYICSRPAP